ncbi:MAG: hypothetical protein D6719_00300 [Candidatus Dadabacteria bacterium]|nr:MAG: hypothetical protein D6719_00300 [Candidatus Dadabacteria bacterium]
MYTSQFITAIRSRLLESKSHLCNLSTSNKNSLVSNRVKILKPAIGVANWKALPCDYESSAQLRES